MSISRRGALLGASAAVAVVAVPTAVAAQPDPLREGIQALVDEIRHHLPPETIMGTIWALQQAADRLEALPGIQALANELWASENRDLARRDGQVDVLRSAGGAPS